MSLPPTQMHDFTKLLLVLLQAATMLCHNHYRCRMVASMSGLATGGGSALLCPRRAIASCSSSASRACAHSSWPALLPVTELQVESSRHSLVWHSHTVLWVCVCAAKYAAALQMCVWAVLHGKDTAAGVPGRQGSIRA